MIKNYNEIIYNINFNHQINITRKDLYLKNGWLFIDLKDDTIEVFKYPVNEYYEAYTHLWNIKKKPFKDFINNEVDFSGEYPKEKNPVKIIFKPKILKWGKGENNGSIKRRIKRINKGN